MGTRNATGYPISSPPRPSAPPTYDEFSEEVFDPLRPGTFEAYNASYSGPLGRPMFGPPPPPPPSRPRQQQSFYSPAGTPSQPSSGPNLRGSGFRQRTDDINSSPFMGPAGEVRYTFEKERDPKVSFQALDEELLRYPLWRNGASGDILASGVSSDDAWRYIHGMETLPSVNWIARGTRRRPSSSTFRSTGEYGGCWLGSLRGMRLHSC